MAWMAGIDDWHGWLAWMTGMDDWHGWLAWMTVMDDLTRFSWLKLFLHIVYRLTDLHWYLLSRCRDWKYMKYLAEIHTWYTGLEVIGKWKVRYEYYFKWKLFFILFCRSKMTVLKYFKPSLLWEPGGRPVEPVRGCHREHQLSSDKPSQFKP